LTIFYWTFNQSFIWCQAFFLPLHIFPGSERDKRQIRYLYPVAYYYTPTHYKCFINLFSDVHEKYQAEIHAYCLMQNHYHLLLHCPQGNLSKIMQYISKVYTQYFNRIHDTDGAIFRGRFKSLLVNADSYLLQVSRYIHLNPVTAKITNDPEHYPWSSYKYYLKSQVKLKWLFRSEILDHFENIDPIEGYKKFVMTGINEKDTFKISEDYPYAFDGLLKLSTTQLHQVPTHRDPSITIEIIINCVAKYFNINPDNIKKKNSKTIKNIPRKIAIYLSYKLTNKSFKNIILSFSDLSERAAAKAYERFISEIKDDNDLLKTIANIKKTLSLVAI